MTMQLTDAEKQLVLRRAKGEYAVDDCCRRIWNAHGKKNRCPEDAPYIEFLRVVVCKTINLKSYEATQRVLLGMQPSEQVKEKPKPKVKQVREKPQSTKKARIDSQIAEVKTDTEESVAEGDYMKDHDGFFRLPPGWRP